MIGAGIGDRIPAIRIYFRNILENSTVTPASENTSYPRHRLHDRHIGRLFKGNSTPSSFYIFIDQGLSHLYPVDTIIIPSGHNLSGLVLQLQYSQDGIYYPYIDSWMGYPGLMKRSFSSVAARYWTFFIQNPASPPEIPELFLTHSYQLQRNPDYGYLHGTRPNVSRIESQSGVVQKTKLGSRRRIFHYSFTRIGDDQRADLETFDAACEGIRSFYVEDMDGKIYFAELPEGGLPPFRAERAGRWGLDLDVLEVVP
jgi:hypothetical protein